MYFTGIGAVFKHNGFDNNSKKEPIVRDHALLNAEEDDEMVSDTNLVWDLYIPNKRYYVLEYCLLIIFK